jgi:adenosylcobinamide-GDP ribazoletransferase
MTFRSLVTAFQFLTIIPIKTKCNVSEKEVRDSSAFFPVVGAFQGLTFSLLSYLLLKWFSPEITASFILVAYLLTTGGFHQDGLSDTFDALSVKSSGNKERDRAKRLSVMKDSTIGPIGVAAIVFSLLLKYLLIKTILQLSGYQDKYLILFLMFLFSKWAMVSNMYHAKSARKDGIGKIFLKHTGLKQLMLCTAFLLLFGFGTFYILKSCSIPTLLPWGIGSFTLFFFSAMSMVYFVCLFLKQIFMMRFGGLTGDNFGAIHEISEIVFLMIALLWKQ